MLIIYFRIDESESYLEEADKLNTEVSSELEEVKSENQQRNNDISNISLTLVAIKVENERLRGKENDLQERIAELTCEKEAVDVNVGDVSNTQDETIAHVELVLYYFVNSFSQ